MKDDLAALRRGVGILITISLFVLAYFAKDLILPVLLGFLVALTLSPINRGLQRVGLPAVVSATILIFVTMIAFLAAFYFVAETARSWSSDIPGMIDDLKGKLSGLSATMQSVQDASAQVEEMAANGPGGPQEVVLQQPGLVNSAVTAVASTVTSFGVAMILALFLLASGDLFYIKLVQTFDTIQEKKRALSTVYDIERRVSHYLLTITAINSGLGVVMAVALYAMGLEYAYIWGIVAFALNFLPIIGGLAGTIFVGIHAILFFDDLSYAILIPIVYQIITSTEAQFFTPYMIGRRMELNIVAVFLTVILWAWLWGIVGALVAVPFLLVFKVICDNFEPLQRIGNFLSNADSPSPEA